MRALCVYTFVDIVYTLIVFINVLGTRNYLQAQAVMPQVKETDRRKLCQLSTLCYIVCRGCWGAEPLSILPSESRAVTVTYNVEIKRCDMEFGT